jgi:hypothetical protein
MYTLDTGICLTITHDRLIFVSRDLVRVEGALDNVVAEEPADEDEKKTRNRRFQSGTSVFSGADMDDDGIAKIIAEADNAIIQVDKKLPIINRRFHAIAKQLTAMNRQISYLRRDNKTLGKTKQRQRRELIQNRRTKAIEKAKLFDERQELQRRKARSKNIIYDGNKLLQSTTAAKAKLARKPVESSIGLFDLEKYDLGPILDKLKTGGRLGIGGCDDGHVYQKVSTYIGGRQAVNLVSHFAIQVRNSFDILSGMILFILI